MIVNIYSAAKYQDKLKQIPHEFVPTNTSKDTLAKAYVLAVGVRAVGVHVVIVEGSFVSPQNVTMKTIFTLYVHKNKVDLCDMFARGFECGRESMYPGSKLEPGYIERNIPPPDETAEIVEKALCTCGADDYDFSRIQDPNCRVHRTYKENQT